MIAHVPLILAAVFVIGPSCLAAAAVMRNRRTPAPNAEQLMTGLGFGIAISIAIIKLCQTLPPYLVS